MSIQVIERDGKPEWAILPYETYLQLVEETQRNLYYSEILSHLSQELLTSDQVQGIYDLSLEAIAATEPGRGAAIFIYDQIEVGVELELVAMWDNPILPEGVESWPAIMPGARFSAEDLGLEALLKGKRRHL